MKALFLSRRKTSANFPIYIVNLFLSLHYAITLYVLSSYLGTFFSVNAVSILFILSAVGNIILFIITPYILKNIGNRKFLLYGLAIEILVTMGLAIGWSPESVAILFIIRGSILMLIYYSLDIFLEENSDNHRTGGIRGSYLTITNTAIAASPLVVAYFALGNEYNLLFWIGAFLLIIPIFIALLAFHNKPVSKKHTSPHLLPVRSFWKSKNIRRVTLSSFTLEMFYIFMIIYMPLYLHQVMLFSWKELGIVFSIMLLPFVIFEWPVGRLADKKYGEKEIMSIGFFLSGISVLLMPFLSANIFIWTAVLFMSRVGASFIEITTESYFFKHVDSRDTGFISLYRLTRPVAMIVGAGLYALALYALGFGATFLVVSLIVLFGLKQSLYLKDTL